MATKTDLILKVVDDGFKGVHHRLDRMNNKIQKHEDKLIRHRIDLIKIQEKDKYPFRGAGLVGSTIKFIIRIMK